MSIVRYGPCDDRRDYNNDRLRSKRRADEGDKDKMKTFKNWAMACAVAFAVASALPASAQSSGGGGGQGSGAGSGAGSGQSGSGAGQTGSGGQTGSMGGAGTTGQAGGQVDQGSQVGRDNRQADLQKFVEKAAISNMAEIQLGQLAQQKAQNPEVKQFAQTMVDEHTKAQSELQQAASAAGISVPSALDSKHQKIHEKLSNLSGSEFDKQYMKVMVDSHNDTRKLLEKRAGKSNASSSYHGSGSDMGSSAGTSGTSGATGTSGTGSAGASGTASGTASGAGSTAGASGSTTGGTETGSSSASGTGGMSSTTGDVDSWAAATLPNVEHHLQMAKDLEKQVKDAGKNDSSKNDKNDKNDK